MDTTIGHQQIVDEYIAACVRADMEREAEKNHASGGAHEGGVRHVERARWRLPGRRDSR